MGGSSSDKKTESKTINIPTNITQAGSNQLAFSVSTGKGIKFKLKDDANFAPTLNFQLPKGDTGGLPFGVGRKNLPSPISPVAIESQRPQLVVDPGISRLPVNRPSSPGSFPSGGGNPQTVSVSEPDPETARDRLFELLPVLASGAAIVGVIFLSQRD